MDQRVFGPYYSTPPENRPPEALIVPTPCTPRRPENRQTKRRILLAARNALKKRIKTRP
ncbi:hypothetical protein ACWD4O_39110 [Streptomyces sp. NPDC002623]